MFTSYEEAIQEIEAGVQDCIGDNPDASEDDAAHDIAVNYLHQCDPPTRHELARCYLGWDPENDRDLYDRHDIPTIGG